METIDDFINFIQAKKNRYESLNERCLSVVVDVLDDVLIASKEFKANMGKQNADD